MHYFSFQFYFTARPQDVRSHRATCPLFCCGLFGNAGPLVLGWDIPVGYFIWGDVPNSGMSQINILIWDIPVLAMYPARVLFFDGLNFEKLMEIEVFLYLGT